MRTAALAGLMMGFAAGAAAQTEFALRGQWNMTFPGNSTYVGIVLIDAERRVTADSPLDNGRPAKFVGYVPVYDEAHVELVLTNRADVIRINCSTESTDLLHCRTRWAGDKTSPMFVLSRVGPGPAKLSTSR